MIHLFVGSSAGSSSQDQARVAFNLFIRFMVGIVAFLGFIAPGFAAETITTEQSRETWMSLIATPLTAREILRSKMRSALWRLRWCFLALGFIWTFGLIAGAVHPLGVVAAALQIAAWTWLLLTCGLLGAVRAKSIEPGNNLLMAGITLLIFTAGIPFLLPARFSSVLLGVASMPFDVWLSLISYRDLRSATHSHFYPPLQWMGLLTKEGPWPVIATCLLGIIGPATLGTIAWKYSVKHFDRLIGRPWRGSDPST